MIPGREKHKTLRAHPIGPVMVRHLATRKAAFGFALRRTEIDGQEVPTPDAKGNAE
jgi:hypothetical protein